MYEMNRQSSSMHDTGCLGLVHWDDPEGWYGEGGGRRVQPGPGSAAVAHTVSALTPRLGAWLAAAPFLFPTLPLATCHPPQGFISSAFSQPPPPSTTAGVHVSDYSPQLASLAFFSIDSHFVISCPIFPQLPMEHRRMKGAEGNENFSRAIGECTLSSEMLQRDMRKMGL